MKTTDTKGYFDSDTTLKANISGEITVNDEVVRPYAYANSTDITKVTIGSNVKYIMEYAFYSLRNAVVDFSKATNLVYIGENAFFQIGADREEYKDGTLALDLSACTNLKVIDSCAFKDIFCKKVNTGSPIKIGRLCFENHYGNDDDTDKADVVSGARYIEGIGSLCWTFSHNFTLPNLTLIGYEFTINPLSTETTVDFRKIMPNFEGFTVDGRFTLNGNDSQITDVYFPVKYKFCQGCAFRFSNGSAENVTLHFYGHPIYLWDYWGRLDYKAIKVPSEYLDEWINDPYWQEYKDIISAE